MKALAFDHVRPASVDEALRPLAADAGARVIAGGQTLIPKLAMRLARPTRLVDVARLSAPYPIRATIGGALANGDPAAEIPLVAGG